VSDRSAGDTRTISPLLFFAFAIAANAPLAFVSLLPVTAEDSLRSAGLTIVLTVALFTLPLTIWLVYSKRIASAGGLMAFVEAAVGRRAALVVGAIWTVSYFLYLPNTVGEISYSQLPAIFPGISPERWMLELALPLALVAIALLPISRVLVGVLAVVVLQLSLMLVLGGLQLYHVGAPISSFGVHGGADIARGTANTALLFVCVSLPLFLGGEVRGGSRTIRTTLIGSYVLTAIYLVFTLFPLAKSAGLIHTEEFGAYDLAGAYGDRAFAILVGLGGVIANLTLILAEYLALSRLFHWGLKRPVRPMVALIGVVFFVASALYLLDPGEVYDKLARPSLFALFLSQVFVFVAFPIYRKLRERLMPADFVLAAVSAGLMIWGLYRVLWSSQAS
jgi:hypothetical protein